MPLTPTIAPPASAATAASSASTPPARGLPSASRQASTGPQTGHALGWAWNRRSAGSSYSARHAAHIVNAAMVVAGRSYGTWRVIV